MLYPNQYAGHSSTTAAIHPRIQLEGEALVYLSFYRKQG
jgi:hypothetical protein